MTICAGSSARTIQLPARAEAVGDGASRIVIAECKVGPLRMSDAMAFDLAEDGRISRIRPHLRPWLATTLFALLLGPQVGRHPGVVRRALRGD